MDKNIVKKELKKTLRLVENKDVFLDFNSFTLGTDKKPVILKNDSDNYNKLKKVIEQYDLKFEKLNGLLSWENVGLENFDCVPDYITKDLILSRNILNSSDDIGLKDKNSLNGMPWYVGGDLILSFCLLKSLEGIENTFLKGKNLVFNHNNISDFRPLEKVFIDNMTLLDIRSNPVEFLPDIYPSLSNGYILKVNKFPWNDHNISVCQNRFDSIKAMYIDEIKIEDIKFFKNIPSLAANTLTLYGHLVKKDVLLESSGIEALEQLMSYNKVKELDNNKLSLCLGVDWKNWLPLIEKNKIENNKISLQKSRKPKKIL